MNLKYFSLLYISAVLLFSFSFQCTSTESTISKKERRDSIKSSVSSNLYFPVNENSRWQYISEAPRDETELFNVNVTSVKDDGADKIVTFDAFPFFYKKNEPATLRLKQNGEVWVITDNSKENLLLPEPSKYTPDYTWQFGEWNGYIVSTTDTVITEKGTFENCVSAGFAAGGITLSANLWLAKGTGIVKWGANRTNPPVVHRLYYVLK